MIVGAQKSGTTALSEFLSEHPQIEIAAGKEAHVFDDSEFDEHWSTDEINLRYEGRFLSQDCCIKGEATPIYLYLPQIARRLRIYNSRLKLIVLLRDPVERAYSHYLMERSRGNENLPYWLALLIEPLRLFRDRNMLSENSAVRRNSYRDRGFYGKQLHELFKEFPAFQILVLRTEELKNQHQETMTRVYGFLGVESYRVQKREVFSQGSSIDEVPISSYFLRKSYRKDQIQLEKLLSSSLKSWRH